MNTFCQLNKCLYCAQHFTYEVWVCHIARLWRAIWRNIQLEGGCIGPTKGRTNTEPESQIFPILPNPRKCNDLSLHSKLSTVDDQLQCKL